MAEQDYSTAFQNYMNPELISKMEKLTEDFKNLEKEHNDLLISLGKEPKELRVFDAEQPTQSMYDKARAGIGSI